MTDAVKMLADRIRITSATLEIKGWSIDAADTAIAARAVELLAEAVTAREKGDRVAETVAYDKALALLDEIRKDDQ